MGQNINKFLLLMWKNLIILKRNPKHTVIEIIAPILFCLILVVVRGLITPVPHSAKFYTPFENQIPVLEKLKSPIEIAWSPKNQFLKKIILHTINAISMENITINHKPFKNRQALANYLNNTFNTPRTFAGIEFNDSLAIAKTFDSHIDVTLRFPGELRYGLYTYLQSYNLIDYSWKTNLLFPLYQFDGPRSYDVHTGAEPSYYYEGFLKLQQEISCAIINYLKQKVANEHFDCQSVNISMQRFPAPRWIDDDTLQTLQPFLGLIILMSFIYNCINTVKLITTEKEKQLKEAMKIMGLPNWLHWTAWFVKSILITLLVVLIITIMLKAKWYRVPNIAVFPNSNVFVIILFLLTYSCATITFCFAVSVFFSKANTAASIAGLLWFINFFPFLLTQNSIATTSLLQNLLVSLFFNSAMGYGFQLMVIFESKGEGIQWENIWKTASPDGNLMLGHLIIMLIVDSFIHLMITLYVDAVFPGDYGVAKPWNFLLLKSTWCSIQYHNDATKLKTECHLNEFHEKEPCNLPVSIQIKQLRKEFSKKVAVNDVCLNIFQNQITILLGHNGAGKTTTMSILTGMLPPTKGTAIINGYDIRTDMQKIRHGLGLCPQHNILFDNFTVYEHLYFYGQLKGIPKSDIENEINKYIKLLSFEDKVNSRASTLSGGMQRKLAVGIALCGGSKIVMLDEPTEGMDPNARRDLWKLLNEQKEDRTILLTTHFMDEADLLGDRIAIMAKGQIQCCGSSFFLKKKYGAGYHLIIVKSSNCDVNNITKLLKKYVPEVILESNIGSELTFSLSEGLSSIFESMLTDLEQNSSTLGILSFGISLMTLEDVFMKVGTEYNDEEPDSSKKLNPLPSTAKTNTAFNYFNEIQIYPKNDNINTFNLTRQDSRTPFKYSLWYKQFLAMAMKRSIAHLRSWPLMLIHNVIPIMCLVLAVIIINASNLNQDLPSRKIELDSYKNSVTVLTFNKENKYFEKYINILENSNNTAVKWPNGNMTTNMFQKAKENKAQVSTQYIVGATFEKNNSIIAWFNNEPYHSPPLSLQLAVNAILQEEVSENYLLQFYNHPQPFGPETKFARIIQTSAMGFQIALNIGFSMAFVTAYYIIFCIQERVCKAKHLQFVSGVNVLIFWMATFTCDFFTFICTSAWILITFVLLQLDSYSSKTELICIFIVLVCFGFATIPLTYLASFLFQVPSTGYTRLILFNIFTGIASLIVAQILTAESLKLEYISESLHWVFLINPHYSLSTAIRDINSMYAIKNHCNTIMDECLTIRANTLFTLNVCKSIICKKKSICCDIPDNYLSWKAPGIGRNIVYMSSLGVVFISILLFIEYGCVDKFLNKFWFNYCCAAAPPSNSNDDSDVKIENEKIRNASQEEINKYNIALRNITKYYNKFLAVDNVCIGINNYECFGLLGINGAGKTTIFKMMTGDMKMSSGNVWINGLNIQTNMKILSKSIGYCPQFDALLDRLTCRETLTIFGLIRGLKLKKCKIMLETLSRKLNFYQHIDKKVEELSKGNKRKLSTAIALLGNPTTLFLDEPTAGMDPASKRCFWNEICALRDSGKCIVVTSHSMEECEALCTRLTIMVNGQFKCLGSIQHLKNKFSQGYTLTIKIRKNLNTNELQEISMFIKNQFQDVVLRDKHQELITYYISNKSLPWSKLFGIMELAKQSLHIEDYSLGQCSLEQVFLRFAKHQQESKNNLFENGTIAT